MMKRTVVAGLVAFPALSMATNAIDVDALLNNLSTTLYTD